jgi:hypothetical protein
MTTAAPPGTSPFLRIPLVVRALAKRKDRSRAEPGQGVKILDLGSLDN